MVDVRIKIPVTNINLTPYAMAKMSDGLFRASENYMSTDIPILNFFLLCASIELGLKSAILSRDNSKEKKDFLRKKSVGHDIEKVYLEFQGYFGDEKLLNKVNILALNKINPFYRKKGLEYITIDVVVALMKGLSSFPTLTELREVTHKINLFLIKNKFFIDS